MTIQAGDIPAASALRDLGETLLTVEKTADETVTSSTTFQLDDELTLLAVPVGTWEIFSLLWIAGTSAGAADFKMRYAWPAGSGGHISWAGYGLHAEWANSATNRDFEANGVRRATTSPTGQAEFGTVTGADRPIQILGRMTNQVAGDLTLSWAQNTSNATGTAVKIGSFLTLRKVPG